MNAVGILGKKMRMTQIPVRGELVGVTPIGIRDNLVAQVKTETKEGYNACQIAFESCRKKIFLNHKSGISKKTNFLRISMCEKFGTWKDLQ